MELFESLISVSSGNTLTTIRINENTSGNISPPRVIYTRNANSPFLTIDPKFLNTTNVPQLGRTPLKMSNYMRHGYIPISVFHYHERESCTLEKYLSIFSLSNTEFVNRYFRVMYEYGRVWLVSSSDKNIQSIEVIIAKDVIGDNVYYAPMIKGDIDHKTVTVEVMDHDIELARLTRPSLFLLLDNLSNISMKSTAYSTISEIFQYSGHMNHPCGLELASSKTTNIYTSYHFTSGCNGCNVEIVTRINDAIANMKFLTKINDLFEVSDTSIGNDASNRYYVKIVIAPNGDGCVEQMKKYFNIMKLNGFNNSYITINIF